MMTRSFFLFLALSPVAAAQAPRICADEELRAFVRAVDKACTSEICSIDEMKQRLSYVDEGALFSALVAREIRPVRIFFPHGESSVRKAFDWQTMRSQQLAEAMRGIADPENAILYVLGSASTSGSVDQNMALSAERMGSVLRYLKEDLRVNCRSFKGGYFGKELMQLDRERADLMKIPNLDYRGDALILNQAVFVFAYPCAHLLTGD